METTSATFPQLFAAFNEQLALAGGHAVIATSLAELPDDLSGGEAEAWVSEAATERFPDLVGVLTVAGIDVRTPSDPATVRDAPLGITAARLAIAETGSVLLVEPDVANRAVSLMTQRLIVLCPADALVPSLDEAAPVLREVTEVGPSYATFVTGPSRTADIERELAIGVQGPGVLQVVFVQDGT